MQAMEAHVETLTGLRCLRYIYAGMISCRIADLRKHALCTANAQQAREINRTGT